MQSDPLLLLASAVPPVPAPAVQPVLAAALQPATDQLVKETLGTGTGKPGYILGRPWVAPAEAGHLLKRKRVARFAANPFLKRSGPQSLSSNYGAPSSADFVGEVRTCACMYYWPQSLTRCPTVCVRLPGAQHQ
jgi:hypothetical protein